MAAARVWGGSDLCAMCADNQCNEIERTIVETTTETTSSSDHNDPLDHNIIGDIRGHFFVPGYQRGYRWDKNDVTRLLDDIWDSKGKDYSLQPIVVKLHKQWGNETEDEWELIRVSVKRGQLTGNTRFSAAVEQIIGRRIERRGSGRPLKG